VIGLILLLLAAIVFFGAGLLTLAEGLALKRDYGPRPDAALAELADRLPRPPQMVETLAAYGVLKQPADPKPPAIRPGSYHDDELFTQAEREPVPEPVPDEERPVEGDEEEHPRADHHTDAWLAFRAGTGREVRSHRRRCGVRAARRSPGPSVRQRYAQWWRDTAPVDVEAPVRRAFTNDWITPAPWTPSGGWTALKTGVLVITPSPELRHANPPWRTTPAPVAEPFFTDQPEPVGASA
jgi:hypothetical protein